MTRIIVTLLAIAAGTAAVASDSWRALDDATRDGIRSKLEQAGYEVRKIEIEDDLFEAYALKDNQRYEIYLDRELNIMKTKLDD